MKFTFFRYSAVHCVVLCIMILSAHDNAWSQITRVTNKDIYPKDIRTGAERTDIYFPWIKDKRIAIVANQTSVIGNVHLVDSLLRAGMNVVKVLCPEHGFRGNAEAGEIVESSTDRATGLPIVSLFGKKLKPKPEDLEGIDLVIFDLQDVGVRFYTYISTMHYIMEACAENNKQLIILDRPNPNGHYIDGPVLKKENSSFIGMDPIAMVHGLTIAELACMINGEGWLKGGTKCDLKYVTVSGYNHSMFYQLPIKPSPNLTDMTSVYLYPSLGLFEGTCVSVGRGTDTPFDIFGHPLISSGDYSFTPRDIPGMATNPPFEGKVCYGYDVREFATEYLKNSGRIYLFWIIELYKELESKTTFFNSAFDMLAGTPELRAQIEKGLSEDEIRLSWKNDLDEYKVLRKKYLLYVDFE